MSEPNITVTNQRPDIVLWSAASKQAVMSGSRRASNGSANSTKLSQILAQRKTERHGVFRRRWAAEVRKRVISVVSREMESASLWLWRKREREEKWIGEHKACRNDIVAASRLYLITVSGKLLC
ncbi:hypothetical protein DPMN_191290 [Dreissena polymorpha]|uniref:Uncharacterized protein n=1 Tax=Dreissena polymorpha TaxID=45954 RepID=A0A9D4BDG9_DREPO|nr:hypothetical protein DPMN_191290 [Dreissena polymorpha]